MFKLLGSLLLVSYCVWTTALKDDPCCVKCDNSQNLYKYFSVVEKYGQCGEACIDPKHYREYKLFEHNLTRAQDSTPCADMNFTVYNGTVTHEFGPIKMTLDLYDLYDVYTTKFY